MNKWKENKNLDTDLLKQLNEMSAAEAHDAFFQNLGFGTGGMRGIIGPGTNRMNIYTIRKVTYAYGKYLMKNFPKTSIVIAYDNRHKSMEFAKDCANVLATMGVKVYIFNRITPTPVLSFAIRHLKTSGGIIITASHNPPQYNGFKVYDNDGCQLLPPAVEKVNEEIKEDLDIFNIPIGNYDEYINNARIVEIGEEVNDAYLVQVKKVAVFPNIKKTNIVVYTPLHGTGAYLGERILKELGYEYYCVEEQMVPDPDFKTVNSPNPEDHSAFDLAIKLAEEKNADLVLATDPDADRLGIAVLHKNEYHFFTGNQVGALLLHYLTNHRLFKGTLFDSIVTSDLGAKIAKSKGIERIQTLTGFKYIGEQIKISENNITLFYFGYEESSGFLIKEFVRDKDAIQTLLLVSEISAYYKQHGRTLVDVLEEIYKKYGYYEDEVMSFVFDGEEGISKMERTIDHFRNMDFESMGFTIMEDYLQSRRYGALPIKISMPKENVIKFITANKNWFAIRPSGTEPKMKIYLSTNGNTKEEAVQAMEKLKTLVQKKLEGVN